LATSVYQSPRGLQSKKSQTFSRSTLELLFENCDLRRHLAAMVCAMWRAAGKPHGKEIQLFAAVEGYRIEARYNSRRSVQYNLRELQKFGIIELVHGANTIRRPATYRLRTDRLGKRQTYTDAKAQRRAPHHSNGHSNGHAAASDLPPQSPTPAQPEPPTPAAVRAFEHSSFRKFGSRAAREALKLRAQLAARIAELMKGCDGYVTGPDKCWIPLKPDDPNYRLPLPRDQAIEQARIELQLTRLEASELLKFWTEEEKP
jgi:hypothetical protein